MIDADIPQPFPQSGLPPIRVLIVDDEALGRLRVRDLLRHESGVDVVGESADGDAAVKAIRELEPDLVFLDVQMPKKSGLDVVREIGAEQMPMTIFVTAFDRYALEAFDVAAIDYLVKPFDDERFEQAFRRARRAVELGAVSRLSSQLIAALQVVQGGAGGGPTAVGDPDDRIAPPVPPTSTPYLERFAVETRGQVRVVPVSKVLYITASGPYAEIHTAERTHLIREQMQVLEERLDPDKFFRVHRSAIVRFELIEGLTRNASGDYTVQLKGGLALKVSRSRSEALEQRMGLAK